MSRLIAVTGGTGFVGRGVLDAFSGGDARLRVLARNPDRLPDAAVRCEAVAGDLEDEAALARLVQKTDTVVHVAGVVAARDQRAFYRINADATARLARAAAGAGVRHFIFVSSLAAREPQLSAYAASKQAAEQALRDLDSPMAVSILRPPAVYGPGDRATLPLIRQLSGRHGLIPAPRDARFSLIHAGDLAAAIRAIAGTGDAGSRTYELDDGQPGGYTWTQIASIAARVTGRPLRLHFLPRSLVAGVARAVQLKQALAGGETIVTPGKVRELYHRDWSARSDLLQDRGFWQPRIGFADGFAQTLAWYQAHGWLPHGAGRTKSCQTSISGDNRS